MKKAAVTGGIAVGKSSLCRILADLGYPVISADEHTARALTPGSSVHSLILKLFHYPDDHILDRKIIAQKIFSDSKIKKKFENLIHPWITQSILKEEKEILKNSPAVVFYEIPLLFEKKLEDRFDVIILVDCPEEEQKKRLMSRMSLSHDEALQRIKAGGPKNKKLLKSHFVIQNNFTIKELKLSALNMIQSLNLGEAPNA